jgi:hypothetical protein
MSPIGFELISRNSKAITTIDEWRNELNKLEQMKFVPGYSAYETPARGRSRTGDRGDRRRGNGDADTHGEPDDRHLR